MNLCMMLDLLLLLFLNWGQVMPKPVQFYIIGRELARPSVIFVMSIILITMMLGIFSWSAQNMKHKEICSETKI